MEPGRPIEPEVQQLHYPYPPYGDADPYAPEVGQPTSHASSGLQNGFPHPHHDSRLVGGSQGPATVPYNYTIPAMRYSMPGQHLQPYTTPATKLDFIKQPNDNTFRLTSKESVTVLNPEGDVVNGMYGQNRLPENTVTRNIYDLPRARQMLQATGRTGNSDVFPFNGEGNQILPSPVPNLEPDSMMNLTNHVETSIANMEGQQSSMTLSSPCSYPPTTTPDVMMAASDHIPQRSVIMHTGNVPRLNELANNYQEQDFPNDYDNCGAFQIMHSRKAKLTRTVVIDQQREIQAQPFCGDSVQSEFDPNSTIRQHSNPHQYHQNHHQSQSNLGIQPQGSVLNVDQTQASHLWNGGGALGRTNGINELCETLPSSSIQSYDDRCHSVTVPNFSSSFPIHHSISPMVQQPGEVVPTDMEHALVQPNFTGGGGEQYNVSLSPAGVKRGRSPRGSPRGRGSGGRGRGRKSLVQSGMGSFSPEFSEAGEMMAAVSPKKSGGRGKKKQTNSLLTPGLGSGESVAEPHQYMALPSGSTLSQLQTSELEATTLNLQTLGAGGKKKSEKRAANSATSLDGSSPKVKKPRKPTIKKNGTVHGIGMNSGRTSPDITSGMSAMQQPSPFSGRGRGRGRGRSKTLLVDGRRKSIQTPTSAVDESRVSADFANIAGQFCIANTPYEVRDVHQPSVGPAIPADSQFSNTVGNVDTNQSGEYERAYISSNIPVSGEDYAHLEYARLPSETNLAYQGAGSAFPISTPNYATVSNGQFTSTQGLMTLASACDDIGNVVLSSDQEVTNNNRLTGSYSGDFDAEESSKMSTAGKSKRTYERGYRKYYDSDSSVDDEYDGEKIPRTTRSRAKLQRVASTSNDSNSQMELTEPLGNETLLQSKHDIAENGLQFQEQIEDSRPVEPSSTLGTQIAVKMNQEEQADQAVASSSKPKLMKPRQIKKPGDRGLKTPKVPLQDSLSSNMVGTSPGGKQKKGRKPREERFESDRSRNERTAGAVKTTTSEFKVPAYTDLERKMLYADKEFLIHVDDADKNPEDVCIWQILENEMCLRQYYPTKHGEKQFFVSSVVKLFFCKEEFRNDTFYATYQPIVVLEAKCDQKLTTPARNRPKMFLDEIIVQYVYMDQQFFRRMAKYIGKIRGVEKVREQYMNCFPIMTMQALTDDFIKICLERNYSTSRFDFPSWRIMTQFLGKIETMAVDVAKDKYEFRPETIKMLEEQPTLRYLSTGVDKSAKCSACGKEKRPPVVRVSFCPKANSVSSDRKPYDRTTFKDFEPGTGPEIPKKDFFWCKVCSTYAKKFHDLYHYRYNLLRLVNLNTLNDIEKFRQFHSPPDDNTLLWVQEQLVNWKNVRFLDLQLCVAEITEESFE